MKVPDDQLRKMLGIANATFKQNEQRSTENLSWLAVMSDLGQKRTW